MADFTSPSALCSEAGALSVVLCRLLLVIGRERNGDRMKRIILASILMAGVLAVSVTSPAAVAAEEEADTCASTPGFQRLDFWLGHWDVYVGARKVGINHIEKVLDGCAVTEDWQGNGGGGGRSLFYYLPSTDTWKQVWITGQATKPGGVKEKTMVEEFPEGGVRFQGEITLKSGRTYLDRTTLTPLAGGRVQQVVEVSRDGGGTWKATFDAVYVPQGEAPAE